MYDFLVKKNLDEKMFKHMFEVIIVYGNTIKTDDTGRVLKYTKHFILNKQQMNYTN